MNLTKERTLLRSNRTVITRELEDGFYVVHGHRAGSAVVSGLFPLNDPRFSPPRDREPVKPKVEFICIDLQPDFLPVSSINVEDIQADMAKWAAICEDLASRGLIKPVHLNRWH